MNTLTPPTTIINGVAYRVELYNTPGRDADGQPIIGAAMWSADAIDTATGQAVMVGHGASPVVALLDLDQLMIDAAEDVIGPDAVRAAQSGVTVDRALAALTPKDPAQSSTSD